MATLLCGYVAMLLCCFVSFSSVVFASNEKERIIVRFKQPQGLAGKISKMTNQGVEIKEKLLLENTFTFEVKSDQAEKMLADLANDAEVEYAEPDYIYHAHEIPNDEHYAKQWGLAKIKASETWDLTHGSSTVKVAILDTGVDKDHPDLSAKVDQWVNFTSSSTEDDYAGHGTHTGGIVAAVTNNEIGVAGTAYDVHLLSVKVLNDSGSGSASWIANGITWAADNGAKVISMSLGGTGSQTMEGAINYAWNKGVVVVASAGNSGVNSLSYPAAYGNVIAVAATGPNDEKSSYSNYGSWVDVTAPGGNGSCSGADGWQRCIVSTYPGNYYVAMKGTSMSCPFVAGLAGLLFSVNPSLTAAQVRNLIEQNADNIAGTGTYWVHGKVNAYQSVLAAMAGVTITPTPTSEVTLTPTPSPTPGGATVTPTPIGEPTATQAPFNCALNGDFNGSGSVDGADLTLWQSAFASNSANISCFEYWRRNKFSN